MVKYEKLSLTRSSLRRHKVFNITWYPRWDFVGEKKKEKERKKRIVDKS